VLLAGNSSTLVLHDQDRRLVEVVISPADHSERSPADVDLRTGRPVWNRHGHRPRISSCAVLELEPEQKPAIRSSYPPGAGRLDEGASLGTIARVAGLSRERIRQIVSRT